MNNKLKLIRSMKFTDLKDMLNKTGAIYGDRPAYISKTEEAGMFNITTHRQFREDINSLGTTLIDMGLKGKKIAVIGENSYEWCVSYLAVAAGTGVIVPLDKMLPNNEIESLILRSEVEAVIYSKKYDEIMNELQKKGNTRIKYFISMELEERTDYIYSFNQLMEKGRDLVEKGNREFIDAKINNEEMGIMLFTSGTTAMSKAVMLSHKNVCANVMDIRNTFELDETDSFLSFLPLHHTFECTVGFLYPISIGAAIAFCDGIRHIAENLKEYHVSAMISVPILFETMYKQILKTIDKQGKTATVEKGRKISNTLLKIGIDVRKKIFKELHDNLGGNLKVLVAGGAALDTETEKGFYELGFNVLQGYGLTETSPVIAAELTHQRKLGSIGKKFPSFDVKIDNPNQDGIGELMAKGPSVMIGYYNNDEANKKTLEKDGWIHTGDLAKIDEDGYIFIAGREKNVIVLKNGKNVFPEEIESVINKIETIKESFVYGRPDKDDDVKICAKIVYDKDLAKMKYKTTEQDEIREKIWEEIKQVNKTMPAYKYVKDITITENELIKTTTQKIKRHEELKKVLK